MLDASFHFEVTPSYFHPSPTDPLIFTDYSLLTIFLNYTKYPCTVSMVPSTNTNNINSIKGQTQ